MAFIPFEASEKTSKDGLVTILIFTEGTVLGPARLQDWFSCAKYVPIKNCVPKIRSWVEQGAKIYYLTSRKTERQVNQIKNILINYGFPGEGLFYRGRKEEYKDIPESLIPNILIDDDCKSIGGERQMTITYVRDDIKSKIKSVVVKEFEGIDHLPGDLDTLLNG